MLKVKDRLVFETTKLSNGITVHTKKTDDPFVMIRIMIPVGSAHNTGGILPGSFHFLEHLVCCRSEMHPQYKAFQKELALHGGGFNAQTWMLNTTYIVDIPSSFFHEALTGLISMVFNPRFNEDDVARERTVIINERKMREPYFPGENELEEYKGNKWMRKHSLDLQTIFGSDQDLESMTLSMMDYLHMNNYRDSGINVIIAGGIKEEDIAKILPQFELITTYVRNNLVHYNPSQWVHQDYHEKISKDTNRFQYCLGLVLPRLSIEEFCMLAFMGKFLTNHVQGPLYKWLREENGWVYGLPTDMKRSMWDTNFELRIPLSKREHVDTVRSELSERVVNAFRDQDLIQREFSRQVANSVFDFQTLQSVVSMAHSHLMHVGRVITESSIDESMKQVCETGYLSSLFEKYVTPETLGTILVVPEHE
ncbi:MAG: insulinase family protein [Candidatus Paceibacterota bacterium]|jgi:predicted Zn-dependent peptidase